MDNIHAIGNGELEDGVAKVAEGEVAIGLRRRRGIDAFRGPVRFGMRGSESGLRRGPCGLWAGEAGAFAVAGLEP